MTVCDVWWRYDELAGFLQFAGGAAFNMGGLPTVIEAGVPEHILWMQSGHVKDVTVAARSYVQLNSLALLYRTSESFWL